MNAFVNLLKGVTHKARGLITGGGIIEFKISYVIYGRFLVITKTPHFTTWIQFTIRYQMQSLSFK